MLSPSLRAQWERTLTAFLCDLDADGNYDTEFRCLNGWGLSATTVWSEAVSDNAHNKLY